MPLHPSCGPEETTCARSGMMINSWTLNLEWTSKGDRVRSSSGAHGASVCLVKTNNDECSVPFLRVSAQRLPRGPDCALSTHVCIEKLCGTCDHPHAASQYWDRMKLVHHLIGLMAMPLSPRQPPRSLLGISRSGPASGSYKDFD